MKKLELKDIAGYLPYGLKIQRTIDTGIVDCGVCGLEVNSKIKIETARRWQGRFINGTGSYKPILRPMSNLTREITHRGKKFIPEKVLEWELRNDEYGKVIDFGDNHSGCILPWDWLDDLDLLNEWMFDYRDLIGQGLAIDVNTLKENCYE